MKITLAALWKMDLRKADNRDKEIIYKVSAIFQATDEKIDIKDRLYMKEHI